MVSGLSGLDLKGRDGFWWGGGEGDVNVIGATLEGLVGIAQSGVPVATS
jgi:hypothetical protein